MMKQLQRRMCALGVTLLFALAALVCLPLLAPQTAQAADFPRAENAQIVALYKTSESISVPTKLSTLDDKVNVTSTIEIKSTDTDMYQDGAFYNNYPYIVFRKSADGNKVAALRIIRNGMLQVFYEDLTQNVLGTNIVLNENSWQPHTGGNNWGGNSWTLKIESTADGVKIYNPDASAQDGWGAADWTVDFTEGFQNLEAAFDINCSGGYQGFLSNIAFGVNDTDMLDLQTNTRLKNLDGEDSAFVVSDVFIDAATAKAGVVYDIPLNKKFIKNKTTGEYEKITDLKLEYTVNYMDTQAMTGENDWDVARFSFFRKADGTKVSARLWRNGLMDVMENNDVKTQINVWRQHAMTEQAVDGSRLYAYSFKILVENGIAKIRVCNAEADTDYNSDTFNAYVLGDGNYIFESGAYTDGATAVNGVTMRILDEGDYDFDDIVDGEYMSLISEEDTQETKMTFNAQTSSYSDDGAKTDMTNREKVSSAFDYISSTNLTTVLSLTVTLDETPASVWEVPNIGFWKAADGTRYELEARDNRANTYVFGRVDETDVQTIALGDNFLESGADTPKTSYTVKISVSKTQTGGNASIALDGKTFSVSLPAGKPVFELFTRGTACTFSNVEFYTPDIDSLDPDKADVVFGTRLTVDEAPTAVKYGDSLAGGSFTLKKSDGTQESLSLEDLTVSGFDENSLNAQTVTFAYSDDYTTLESALSVTLSDYAVGIYCYGDNEVNYGEACPVTVMAETASGNEIDVTENVVLSGFDSETAGEQTVTISYTDPITQEEFTDTFTVTVKQNGGTENPPTPGGDDDNTPPTPGGDDDNNPPTPGGDTEPEPEPIDDGCGCASVSDAAPGGAAIVVLLALTALLALRKRKSEN